jgi:hypothetical protein
MLGPDPSIHGRAGLKPLRTPDKHGAAERWILASAREYDGDKHGAAERWILASAREYDGWCRRSAAGR